jgi:hypothetical protein
MHCQYDEKYAAILESISADIAKSYSCSVPKNDMTTN